MGDVIDQIFQLLQQLILPNWPDLIALLPWVIGFLVFVSLFGIARMWIRAGSRYRPRVPKPVAGAPPPGIHMPGPSRWPFFVPIGAALLLFAFALPPKDAQGNATALFNLQLLAVGLVVLLIAIGGWLWDAMREWRATAQADVHGAAAGHGGHAVAVTAGSNAAVALMPSERTTTLQRRGGMGLVAAAQEPAYREPPPGVHMPGPSPWPFFVPIAATVGLYGFIFSSVLIVAGIILFLIAITGWYLEAGREYFSTEAVGHAVPVTRDPYKAWPRRLVPVFIGVIAISFAITLAPLGLGFLNSLTPPEATAKPVTVPANPVIAAQGVKFDTANLLVPAGRAFELTFNNNDDGVPHNVQIDTADKSSTLFDGEIINGVATAKYAVPALEPGTYYFLCKVHPNMNGTVTAAAETGGAGAPAPGDAPGASGGPGAPAGGTGSAAPQASQAP